MSFFSAFFHFHAVSCQFLLYSKRNLFHWLLLLLTEQQYFFFKNSLENLIKKRFSLEIISICTQSIGHRQNNIHCIHNGAQTTKLRSLLDRLLLSFAGLRLSKAALGMSLLVRTTAVELEIASQAAQAYNAKLATCRPL